MGSTKVEAPQPTQAEQDLQKAQLAGIQSQQAQDAAMRPLLLRQQGLQEVNGQIQEIPWEQRLAAMNPQDRANYDLQKAYIDRQQLALEGKLPVSPGMESNLAEQQKILQEGLSRKGGSGYNLSTAGIQSLGLFNRNAEMMREEARRGQISSGQGLISSGLSNIMGQQGQQYSQGQNMGLPGFSALQGAYGQAYQPFQFNRNMEFQANQQTAANRAGLLGGAMGMVGTAGGIGLAKYLK